MLYFNSRPSARGDQTSCLLPFFFQISIHAPPRGATGSGDCEGFQRAFQFTPLREGRPVVGAVTCRAYTFQFTPLREGRRPLKRYILISAKISIHAPPRGATFSPSAALDRTAISIHAPPRGATSRPRWIACGASISIHAPPRGATADMASFYNLDHISIHAPPRGATGCFGWQSRHRLISIHAPPRGATSVGFMLAENTIYFNSRPSARGDEYMEARKQPTQNFNSRPSARGDLSEEEIEYCQNISIHAPPRGATKKK